MKIEIVTFVINGSMKMNVPPDQQKKIQVKVLLSVVSLISIQQDKSCQGYSQTLGCLWTKNHRCIDM